MKNHMEKSGIFLELAAGNPESNMACQALFSIHVVSQCGVTQDPKFH